MTPKKASVDVAVAAYGKPYQTAVSILTLLKHSGEWIDKIYFTEEKKQPEPVDFQFIMKKLGDRGIYYKPYFWFWVSRVGETFRKFRPYRQSIRYQYAWEKTDKDYLLIMHNDMYFTGDLVGEYLKGVGDNTGIGKIGQCWNCPAFSAKVCDGDSYAEYRPTYEELMELSARYPGARSHSYKKFLDSAPPWPLPECRLNEYVALINMSKARGATVPNGKAAPFGVLNRIDTGVEWFSDLNNSGHTFANFNYDPYAVHSWVSGKNAGHAALFDKDLYHYEESVALQCLKDEFGFVP
jgi:hypothetical protein